MLGTLALSIGTAAGVCTGIAFVVAGVGKLRHRAELPGVIANYRLLPAAAITPAALALPWVEGVTGVALLAGGRIGGVAAVPAILLLLVFAAAMGVNIRRGRSQIDCGCGISGLRQPLRRALVYRNLAMVAGLVPLAIVPGALGFVEHGAAIVTGIVAFLFVLLLNALLALPATRPLTA